jgi:hypothetical protein
METRPGSPSLAATHLWRLMQRIEYCRHRAEMVEARATEGSEIFQEEMAEVARQWRDLAHEIELLDRSSDTPAFRRSPPTD